MVENEHMGFEEKVFEMDICIIHDMETQASVSNWLEI